MPFAVGISTAEVMSEVVHDYYLIVPRDQRDLRVKPKEYVALSFKTEKYIPTKTETMTDEEIVWFKVNSHLFDLTLNCPDGRVYEPKNQPPFKHRCKKIQTKLL